MFVVSLLIGVLLFYTYRIMDNEIRQNIFEDFNVFLNRDLNLLKDKELSFLNKTNTSHVSIRVVPSNNIKFYM